MITKTMNQIEQGKLVSRGFFLVSLKEYQMFIKELI